ncbi:MAG: glycosyltransferase family 2 protein [Alkalispirochaeta sp.]
MKLIIQIPCYNEAATIGTVLHTLPREVEGFDTVEWLIIDDGSTDNTADVAREHGVDHVVRFSVNRGLASGFIAGLDACLRLGADVIVNTDADNQYESGDIPTLVAPILAGEAEMVIGERPIDSIKDFSPFKKRLQHVGSSVVRAVSHTDVADAPSGFRAIARQAAMQLNVHNPYTYTLETIIQAGHKGIAIANTPVRVNTDLRPSRLVKSIGSYVRRSLGTILRFNVVYRPFPFFFWIGVLLFLPGVALGVRFLFFYFAGAGDGHVQSLILASVLLGFGFHTMLVAFVADLIAVNRRISEDIQYRVRKLEYGDSPGDKKR